MNVKSKQTEEKLNGVFYTPFEIVRFLTSWITDKQQIFNVLEPSAGDGRFVKQIVEFADKANVTAVEIDSLECEKIKNIDNTRVIAARDAGITATARVHQYTDPLPEEFIDRFTTRTGTPSTWGEAVQLRVGKQKSSFRTGNPYGSYDLERRN